MFKKLCFQSLCWFAAGSTKTFPSQKPIVKHEEFREGDADDPKGGK